MEIYNYIKINDKVALAGQPSAHEFEVLIANGVNCVINIAPYDERYSIENEAELVEKLAATYIYYPIDFANPTLADFAKVEALLLDNQDNNVLLHCAANYRASLLFGHFAIRHLGWSRAEKNALINQIWSLDDFPAWKVLDEKLEAGLNDDINTRVADVIEKYLVQTGDGFAKQGRAELAKAIAAFTSQEQAVQLVLPGFPCKSPNIDAKSFSNLPDYGEVFALERMQSLCDDIQDIYPVGAKLTIISDGATFSDLVGVDDAIMQEYNAALRTLTITHDIQWADLTDLCQLEKANSEYDSAYLRKQLLKNLTTNPRALQNYTDKVKKDAQLRIEHDDLCSYLYNDVCLVHLSQNDRDDYLASICDKAYEMMFRGKALTHSINERFSNHIRLSTHRYDNTGPKFTIALSANNQQVLAPWHAVPVMRLNGNVELMPHATAKELNVANVTFENSNWMYIEVSEARFTAIQFEVLKSPRFGLRINLPSDMTYQELSPQFLTMLSQEFGFVLLPNAGLEEEQELVELTAPFGEIYQWQFGPVHVVKPEEKPHGFVHSIEKTPLHWDLSMLPLDHERVIDNERFYASTFLLYCKTAAQPGEGQTTIVDSRNVLKLAGRKKVREWQETEVIYSTKMTYFGGVPRVYPLVFEHPKNGELLLRYQEGSDSQLQTFELSSEQLESNAFNALISEVNALCYDERCMIAHDWQDGDLIIVDNHYTLHGRLPMTELSMNREVWRVQVI